ncbi:MAG: hypothetical protein IJM51_10920 [Clostridia bacterium]|nr:hypothetical protein [Clostridia bacterium]
MGNVIRLRKMIFAGDGVLDVPERRFSTNNKVRQIQRESVSEFALLEHEMNLLFAGMKWYKLSNTGTDSKKLASTGIV